MVISENSLYGLILGPMVAKGRGIPLKVCFLPGLVGKEDKRIVQHAGIQQGHETLPSNMVGSNVVIINGSGQYGLILGSKLATALGNSKSSDAILKQVDDEDRLESRIAISG